MSYADVIDDPDLKQFMLKAERALTDGRVQDCLRAVYDAFDMARHRWGRQVRKREGLNFRPHPSDLRDDRVLEYLDAEVHATSNLLEMQAFALSAGECVWFQDLMADSTTDYVTVDEAWRAFHFVFWWIVNWQTTGEDFADRRDRFERSLRAVRGDDEPAEIGGIEVEPDRAFQPAGLEAAGCAVRLTVHLVSVPQDEGEYLAVGERANVVCQAVRRRVVGTG